MRDLNPKQFAATLRNDLHIDFPKAKTVAQEIEEKILRPVAKSLLDSTGLDTRDIYLGKEELLPEEELHIPLIAPELARPEAKPKLRMEDVQSRPKVAESANRVPETAPAEDAPFILHEEKPLFAPSNPGAPSFSFKNQDTVRKPSSAVSPEAKIKESSQQPFGMRVVHYSNLRTLLRPTDLRQGSREL
jgi:hypothetical protein